MSGVYILYNKTTVELSTHSTRFELCAPGASGRWARPGPAALPRPVSGGPPAREKTAPCARRVRVYTEYTTIESDHGAPS